MTGAGVSRARAGIGALAALLLGVALAPGCATGLPRPGVADAQAAQSWWPGTRTEDLEHGRSLYVTRCGGCHVPIAPTEIASVRWPDWVRKMAPRSKLSEAESDDVVRYLVVLARGD